MVPGAPMAAVGTLHSLGLALPEVGRGFAVLQVDTANFRNPLFVFVNQTPGMHLALSMALLCSIVRELSLLWPPPPVPSLTANVSLLCVSVDGDGVGVGTSASACTRVFDRLAHVLVNRHVEQHRVVKYALNGQPRFPVPLPEFTVAPLWCCRGCPALFLVDRLCERLIVSLSTDGDSSAEPSGRSLPRHSADSASSGAAIVASAPAPVLHSSCPPTFSSLHTMTTEFQRQGVPGSRWRISTINQHYDMCPTYPAVLAFPSSVTDAQLLSAAEFRSQRTPKSTSTSRVFLSQYCLCRSRLGALCDC